MPEELKDTNEILKTDVSAALPPKPTPPGFLKDADGNPSSMRFMSVIALFASIWFGWMTLDSNMTSQNGVYVTTAFLLAAFAPKALQKFIENYYPKAK